MVAVTIAIILFSVCDNYNYVVVRSRWLLDFVFFLLLHFISQNYLIVFNPYAQKKPDYISQHHIESKEYERFVFILWILSIYSSEKKTLDPLTNNSSRWIEYIYTRTEGFKFHQEFNLLFFLVKHTERERDHSKQLCCFPLFIFSGNLIFVVDLLIHTHTHTHRKTCYFQLWRWWWWFFWVVWNTHTHQWWY